MKKVTATFTGKNGSRGFITGNTYTLLIHHLGDTSSLEIVREDGQGDCEYSSIITFLNNWTDIQVLIKES